jgi:hypothetical protein
VVLMLLVRVLGQKMVLSAVLSNGRARGRELALVPAGSRCCKLRVGKSEAATER